MDSIFIGKSAGGPEALNLKRANRHGLIAGATGTGKTVTLQGLVEGFSAAGVPTFVADVKGDLSGMAMAGSPQSKTHEIFAGRATEINQENWAYKDNPTPILGFIWRAGSSHSNHCVGNGTAAFIKIDGP